MFLDEEYKVIKILSKYSILIDYGYKQGAKKGKTIRVVKTGDEIIYNDTKYGTYDFVKEELQIVNVFENFSECRKFILKPSPFTRDLTSMANSIASIISSSKQETELNVNEKEISPLIENFNEIDETIYLGDTVKIISIDK